ncbi:hypothetical protein C8R44DRAFT_974785 [Mycena epipterygia]|nr:hypothetical protein C8R44DRAFT_974785 [Mycena epipterygia]
MVMNSQPGIPRPTRLSTIPILNAPTEILREIFKRCLDLRYPHVQPFSSTEAPMLLCGVCGLWRTIAISTPELWANLSVSVGRNTAGISKPSLPLVKIWIERSGCQPLTLVLQDFGLPSGSADVASDLLDTFLPHIHKWQSITFTLPNHTLPVSLTAPELPYGSASHLQIAKLEFGIDAFHAGDTPQITGLSRLLTSSSQLHTLYWRNDPCTLEFLDIRWAQLTVIDLIPFWTPLSQIVRVMRKAPRLRSLSCFITEAETHDIGAPLVLPDLVILWIGTEVDISPLFQRLSLPSLLKTNVFCANLVVPQTNVVRCIARSGSLVDTAIFKSLRIPKADLITFLRSSPSLRLLEISNHGEATITNDILTMLTARDARCLCPNLQIVRFLESSVSADDGLLADMVASRRADLPGSVAPLSRLVVHFSEADLSKHAEDIRRLTDLGKAAGLRVWINEPETA